MAGEGEPNHELHEEKVRKTQICINNSYYLKLRYS